MPLPLIAYAGAAIIGAFFIEGCEDNTPESHPNPDEAIKNKQIQHYQECVNAAQLIQAKNNSQDCYPKSPELESELDALNNNSQCKIGCVTDYPNVQDPILGKNTYCETTFTTNRFWGSGNLISNKPVEIKCSFYQQNNYTGQYVSGVPKRPVDFPKYYEDCAHAAPLTSASCFIATPEDYQQFGFLYDNNLCSIDCYTGSPFITNPYFNPLNYSAKCKTEYTTNEHGQVMPYHITKAGIGHIIADQTCTFTQ